MGYPRPTDDLALADRMTNIDGHRTEVAVGGQQPAAVIDGDRQVVDDPTGKANPSGGCRSNGRRHRDLVVDSEMPRVGPGGCERCGNDRVDRCRQTGADDKCGKPRHVLNPSAASRPYNGGGGTNRWSKLKFRRLPEDPMSKKRIGLMGFGRIGRNVFRHLDGHPSLEVGLIVDTAEPEGLTYLLKYDSIYGRFPKPVGLVEGNLVVDGHQIPFSQTKEPADCKWGEANVDLVVHAVGKYRTKVACQQHLEAGATGVVLASTPDDPSDLPILLRGINDELLTPEVAMVALGSNTSNAIAPILRILDGAFGINRAFFTTVHAITNAARLADVPSSGFRTSRAAGENIIPAETNSPTILETVMPEFAGKLSAVALNVPVTDGSTVDLVTELGTATDKANLNEAIHTAARGRYKGLIEYATDPIVSSDVRTSSYSGVFDSLASMVIGGSLAKSITWFNNGWAYAARVVDVLEKMAAR